MAALALSFFIPYFISLLTTRSQVLMKLGHVFSRQTTNDSLAPPRRHVPWISSPIEKRTNKSVRGCETPEVSTISLEAGTINFEMTRRSSEDDAPRFKKHHEASSIELFYDLFFVANLATFTANHEIEDRPCMSRLSSTGIMTHLFVTTANLQKHSTRIVYWIFHPDVVHMAADRFV